MNRKAFTLIEILISIVLLAIIILFLYKALNIAEYSNKFFGHKLEKYENKVNLKKILFLDIVHSIAKENKILEDRRKNSVFLLKTSSSYHNSFCTNITYLVSKENNLLRIESKVVFNKDKLNDDFFENSFVDTIVNDIEKFKIIIKNTKEYVIYMKFKDENSMMFTVKSMR